MAEYDNLNRLYYNVGGLDYKRIMKEQIGLSFNEMSKLVDKIENWRKSSITPIYGGKIDDIQVILNFSVMNSEKIRVVKEGPNENILLGAYKGREVREFRERVEKKTKEDIKNKFEEGLNQVRDIIS